MGDLKMKEIWKDVKGFEGRYLVSNTGKIYSVLAKRILKTCISNKGYELACLRNEKGYRKQYTVHRLVALTFIENPKNYSIVNHKDENKLNNCVENLEWCDYSYNNSYSNSYFYVYDKNLNYIGSYNNINKFARDYNCNPSHICQNLKLNKNKNKLHYHKNYVFLYNKL